MARSGSHCQEGGQISSANLCWPLGNSRLNLGSLFNYSSSPLLSPIYDFRLLVLFPGLMPFVYICIFGQEWMNQWFGRKKKPPNSKLESFYGHEALFKHIPWWNKMLPTGSKHSHLMCNLVWCLWALHVNLSLFTFCLFSLTVPFSSANYGPGGHPITLHPYTLLSAMATLLHFTDGKLRPRKAGQTHFADGKAEIGPHTASQCLSWGSYCGLPCLKGSRWW